MLYDPKHARHDDPLEDSLRAAVTLAPALMRAVTAQRCVRLSALGPGAKARIDRLIESGAWTDAALTLLAFELPQWSLRRLVCEDGEWLCTLSREPALPIELDDVVEARHEDMPLAILTALLEARRIAPSSATKASSVPEVRPVPGVPVVCDNFT